MHVPRLTTLSIYDDPFIPKVVSSRSPTTNRITDYVKLTSKLTINMLTSLLLLPLFGALLLCTLSDTTPAEQSRVKNVALVTSLATFILSIVM